MATLPHVLLAATLSVLSPASQPRDTEGAADAGPEPAVEITARELEHHVRFLASDEMAGRAIGSPELARAARYLARAFERTGLEPGGDGGTFLQRVPLERAVHTAQPELRVRTAAGERMGTHGVDFHATVRGRPDEARELRILTVRAAEDLTDAEGGHAVWIDAPARDRRDWLEARGSDDGRAFGLELRAGSETPGGGARELPRASWQRVPTADERDTPDFVRLDGPLLEHLRSGEIHALELTWQVRVEPVEEANVVALLRGAGTADRPGLANEALVLSAHFDHVGTAEGAAAADPAADAIYNGADDDASGTAALLELAQALAGGPRPARTVVFLCATGEERGLLGTWHYLDHPAVPLERTIANLNFEMIGRPDELVGGPGRLWLTGFERTTLGPGLVESGIEIAPDPRPEQNFFERSDNIAFVRRGVIGQTLSSYGMHADYHQPSDEADTLDYDHMETVVRKALRVVRNVAGSEPAPDWLEGGKPASK